MTRNVPAKQAERWSAPAQHLQLLTDLGERIGPEDPALDEWYQGYRKQHLDRLAHDLGLVQQHAPAHARVLEYGAVPLLTTAALAALGYRISGLDLAPQRFASAIVELDLDVRQCDVETETVPIDDESVDLILFNELFEHLRIDPIFTLREAWRVARPGALLLLSTPNLRSLRGIRNLVLHNQGHSCSADVYRQYEKLKTLGHMGHVREYTTLEVADFLERVGFRVERVIYRGGHGRGVVGLVERLLPSLRPFFSVVARRAAPASATKPGNR